MIFLYLIAFFGLTFILIKSADLVLLSIRSISRSTGTKSFVLSALVLSVATSLPELFVAITSSLNGVSTLSLGNVLGANITNLTLVVGLSAVIAGSVAIHGGIVKKEILMATIAGTIPIFLSIDGNLSRVDGLVLLATYVAYVTSFFELRFIEIGTHFFNHKFILRIVKNFKSIDQLLDGSLGRLFVGIAALLFSADLIVNLAKLVASNLNLPVFLVGLILLSLGTTLPELAVSFKSIKTGQPGIFFGNLMGSIIVNSTLVIGIAVVVNPITLLNLSNEIYSAVAFIVSFVVFWLFVKTKACLEKWEAVFLLLIYIIFVISQFIRI